MYNSSWYQIMSNDDGGSGSNFRISYNVKAGRTYYFGAGYYGGVEVLCQNAGVSFQPAE